MVLAAVLIGGLALQLLAPARTLPPLDGGLAPRHMTMLPVVEDSIFTFAESVVRLSPSRSAAAFLLPPALRRALERRFHSNRLTALSKSNPQSGTS